MFSFITKYDKKCHEEGLKLDTLIKIKPKLHEYLNSAFFLNKQCEIITVISNSIGPQYFSILTIISSALTSTFRKCPTAYDDYLLSEYKNTGDSELVSKLLWLIQYSCKMAEDDNKTDYSEHALNTSRSPKQLYIESAIHFLLNVDWKKIFSKAPPLRREQEQTPLRRTISMTSLNNVHNALSRYTIIGCMDKRETILPSDFIFCFLLRNLCEGKEDFLEESVYIKLIEYIFTKYDSRKAIMLLQLVQYIYVLQSDLQIKLLKELQKTISKGIGQSYIHRTNACYSLLNAINYEYRTIQTSIANRRT